MPVSGVEVRTGAQANAVLNARESTMAHTVWMKRLTYDHDRELVAAELSGEMGGRHVDVQLQFALRAHG